MLLPGGTRYRGADVTPTPYKSTHISVGGSREASERGIRATLSRRSTDPLLAWADTEPKRKSALEGLGQVPKDRICVCASRSVCHMCC